MVWNPPRCLKGGVRDPRPSHFHASPLEHSPASGSLELFVGEYPACEVGYFHTTPISENSVLRKELHKNMLG